MIYRLEPRLTREEISMRLPKILIQPGHNADHRVAAKKISKPKAKKSQDSKQRTDPSRTPSKFNVEAITLIKSSEDANEAVKLFDERRRQLHLSSEQRRREKLGEAFERAKEVLEGETRTKSIEGSKKRMSVILQSVQQQTKVEILESVNKLIQDLEARKQALEEQVLIKI